MGKPWLPVMCNTFCLQVASLQANHTEWAFLSKLKNISPVSHPMPFYPPWHRQQDKIHLGKSLSVRKSSTNYNGAGVCLLLPLSEGPFRLASAGQAKWECGFGYSLSTMMQYHQHWDKRKPTLIRLTELSNMHGSSQAYRPHGWPSVFPKPCSWN